VKETLSDLQYLICELEIMLFLILILLGRWREVEQCSANLVDISSVRAMGGNPALEWNSIFSYFDCSRWQVLSYIAI
jgi:hypothetical protein